MAKGEKPSSDYGIGWGKPPAHTRFKPGRSGNPKGRPAGTRNLKTDLVIELGRRIRVREGDREISISKQEAFLKSLVARALKGDSRATTTLVNLMARTLELAAPPPQAEETVHASDQAIIDSYIARRAAEDANKHEAPEANASPGREPKTDESSVPDLPTQE